MFGVLMFLQLFVYVRSSGRLELCEDLARDVQVRLRYWRTTSENECPNDPILFPPMDVNHLSRPEEKERTKSLDHKWRVTAHTLGLTTDSRTDNVLLAIHCLARWIS